MQTHKRTFKYFLLATTLFATVATQAHADVDGDPAITNTAAYSYATPDGAGISDATTAPTALIDPRGRIRDCDGKILPSYKGFTVGMYVAEPNDPTGSELKTLVSMTPTAVPAVPGTPQGIFPNTSNANPYPLSDADDGTYSFLLDPNRGQLDAGDTYILVVSPPSGSAYPQRRIRIKIISHTSDTVLYSVKPVDGLPLNGAMNTETNHKAITFTDGNNASSAIGPTIDDCISDGAALTKIGDHDSAEAGDTVVYQINVKNSGTNTLTNVKIEDDLPIGFSLIPKTVKCVSGKTTVPMTFTASKRQIIFSLTNGIAPQAQATIMYATTLSPDALRGDGRNTATMTAGLWGDTSGFIVNAGPAAYSVKIRPGLLSDQGTIIGRVFVDANGDGEQHNSDEPGVANAVVLLDDGTRVTTDPNGLFSIPNVASGYHAAVLDLRATPGYKMAKSHRMDERGSTRVIRLEAGGMARLNFGVVPVKDKDQAK